MHHLTPVTLANKSIVLTGVLTSPFQDNSEEGFGVFPALLVRSLHSVLYFLALRSAQHRGIVHIEGPKFVLWALQNVDKLAARVGGKQLVGDVYTTEFHAVLNADLSHLGSNTNKEITDGNKTLQKRIFSASQKYLKQYGAYYTLPNSVFIWSLQICYFPTNAVCKCLKCDLPSVKTKLKALTAVFRLAVKMQKALTQTQ